MSFPSIKRCHDYAMAQSGENESLKNKYSLMACIFSFDSCRLFAILATSVVNFCISL